MTDEKLERRIVLAEAMGYHVTPCTQLGFEHRFILWEPDGSRKTWQDSEQACWEVGAPDFDTDAEAWERLLEWARKSLGDVVITAYSDKFAVFVYWKEGEQLLHRHRIADTYAEALVSAIYAAVLARQRGPK